MTIDPATSRPSSRTLWGLFVAALAIRGAFLLVSDNNDGDAYARLMLARKLTEQTSWIASEIWLPVHFWIIATPYFLGATSEVWPRAITALAGAASVPAMALLTQRWFGSPAGVLAGVALLLSPLHIRFSILSVAEIFLMCFATVGLWGFVAHRDSGRTFHLAVGALAFNLACGQRMEAWILVAMLPLSLVFPRWLHGGERSLLLSTRVLSFTALSSVFMVLWSTYSWVTYGNPLHIATLNVGRVVTDQVYQSTSVPYVLAFWPLALLTGLNPLVTGVALLGVASALATGPQREAAAAFVAMLFVYYVQNARSAMITDARYSLFLATLLLPSLATGLTRLTARLPTLRRSFAPAVVAASAAWLVVVWGAAESDAGLATAKMSSISPRPLYEADVRTVNDWLRGQADVDAVLVGPFVDVLTRYGPWLSLFEMWKPRPCIDVVKHGQNAAELLGRHAVVHQVTDVAEPTAVGATPERVFQAGPYLVYRWANPTIDTRCGS